MARATPESQVLGAPVSLPFSYSSGYSPMFQTRPTRSCASKASSDSCSCSVVEVSFEDDQRADPVDRLRQIGDGGHDAVLVQRAVVASTVPLNTVLAPGTSGSHVLSILGRSGKWLAENDAIGSHGGLAALFARGRRRSGPRGLRYGDHERQHDNGTDQYRLSTNADHRTSFLCGPQVEVAWGATLRRRRWAKRR